MRSVALAGGRVAVIGAGHVGAATVNALVLLGAADHVVLYDRDLGRAEGQAWDAADGTLLVRGVEIIATDDWRALRRVDVAVVTVGPAPQPGRSRLDERNGGLVRQVVARLDEVAPHAVVVIVMNPVDVMARIAQEASVRAWHLILGTGTMLDTARLGWGWRRGSASMCRTCMFPSSASTATAAFQRGRARRSVRCL